MASTAENKLTWASKETHVNIAEMLIKNDVTPEEFLDDLRVDDDYVLEGKRIYGKSLCAFYYQIKRESAALDRIKAIKKAKKTEDTQTSEEEANASSDKEAK